MIDKAVRLGMIDLKERGRALDPRDFARELGSAASRRQARAKARIADLINAAGWLMPYQARRTLDTYQVYREHPHGVGQVQIGHCSEDEARVIVKALNAAYLRGEV